MTPGAPSPGRQIHGWTRDLHLYAGLFLSPFILIFAFSTLALNHPGQSRAAAETGAPWTQPVEFDPGAPGTLSQARSILGQLRLTGEIDNVMHNKKAGRLTIPVSKPGELTTVTIDLASSVATVQRKAEGMAAALVYLHKRPGPHLVMFRGNWVYMAGWGILHALHTFNGVGTNAVRAERDWPLTRLWTWSMDALAVGLIALVATSLILAYERRDKWLGAGIAFAVGCLAGGFFAIGLSWM